MRYAYLYGLGEGPAHARKLNPALKQAGLQLIQNPHQADILLAHSGGVFSLPANLSNKIVILIAPSHQYPQNGLITTVLAKVKLDIHHHIRTRRLRALATKTLLNFYYLATRPHRALRMYQAIAQSRHPLPDIIAKQVIVICYRYDPWSNLIMSENTKSYPNYNFLSLDDAHDDLWTAPDNLVQTLRRLIQQQ